MVLIKVDPVKKLFEGAWKPRDLYSSVLRGFVFGLWNCVASEKLWYIGDFCFVGSVGLIAECERGEDDLVEDTGRKGITYRVYLCRFFRVIDQRVLRLDCGSRFCELAR